MNNETNLAAIEKLINDGNAVNIPAGEWILTYTSCDAMEGEVLPGHWFFEENDFFVMNDGAKITSADLEHYIKILDDDLTFQGNDRGFHYGLVFRKSEDFAPHDLEFLRVNKIAHDYTISMDSVLIDNTVCDDEISKKLGIKEETFFALISSSSVVDVLESTMWN